MKISFIGHRRTDGSRYKVIMVNGIAKGAINKIEKTEHRLRHWEGYIYVGKDKWAICETTLDDVIGRVREAYRS